MRSLWNFVSDPTLHLLAIALFLVYLTVAGGPRWRDSNGEAPLPSCKICHNHFMPGKLCECPLRKRFATAAP
jgi:hypothetical protein